jgi:hypothetical protein
MRNLHPSYGFQTHTKLRLVISIALVDAAIKDSDIVAVFRAIHHLVLQAVNNPFLSLPPSFKARPAVASDGDEKVSDETEGIIEATKATTLDLVRNEPTPEKAMFGAGPDDIRPEWLTGSKKFTTGVAKLGELLCARS